MIADDDTWWPDVLDSMESEHLADAAEDQQVAKKLAKSSHGEAAALRREVPAGIPGRPSCNPRSRVAADCGSHHRAAAGEAIGAADPAAAIAAPDMTAQDSDDIGLVSRQIRIAEERLVSIAVAIRAAGMDGDEDAYGAAREAFSVAYSELVTLEGRLLDLEGREERAERMALLGWFQWATR